MFIQDDIDTLSPNQLTLLNVAFDGIVRVEWKELRTILEQRLSEIAPNINKIKNEDDDVFQIEEITSLIQELSEYPTKHTLQSSIHDTTDMRDSPKPLRGRRGKVHASKTQAGSPIC
ncbi:uncharacterized protein LOC118761446 [Octopus sinensis]|uniref:Uncharacterized protein LOC118761446 n=1 Tax=Octopus sinensis TaxID=2607531 RepID=A0A7E6EJT3_9MOLL|nr:uncharacterized protein LOC118761446 [Octopus sinensis]